MGIEGELRKVGEVARRTGLTVRTLHHYDEIGLLVPSHRAGSGYRLYTAADLAKLQQIVSLRQLGFSLEEIRECLTRPGFDPLTVVRLHLARAREVLNAQNRLCDRLEALSRALESADEVSADEFLQTIEVTVMFEKYYTPQQMEYLKARREVVGEERMKQVSGEWAALQTAVQAEMDAGTDPSDPKVQALAAKWMEMVSEFTGGDPGILASLNKMYESEPAVAGMDLGPMRAQREFIQKALDAKT